MPGHRPAPASLLLSLPLSGSHPFQVALSILHTHPTPGPLHLAPLSWPYHRHNSCPWGPGPWQLCLGCVPNSPIPRSRDAPAAPDSRLQPLQRLPPHGQRVGTSLETLQGHWKGKSEAILPTPSILQWGKQRPRTHSNSECPMGAALGPQAQGRDVQPPEALSWAGGMSTATGPLPLGMCHRGDDSVDPLMEPLHTQTVGKEQGLMGGRDGDPEDDRSGRVHEVVSAKRRP